MPHWNEVLLEVLIESWKVLKTLRGFYTIRIIINQVGNIKMLISSMIN